MDRQMTMGGVDASPFGSLGYEDLKSGQPGRKERWGRWLTEKGPQFISGQRYAWINESRPLPSVKPPVEAPNPRRQAIADDREAEFWHSGWNIRRKRVMEGMDRIGVSHARRSAYKNCGAEAWVFIKKDGSDHRVRASFCHDRFCVRCAAAKAAKVRKSFQQLQEGKACLFITLTIRHQGEPLRVLLQKLLDAFSRLRARQYWKSSVRGGGYIVEIKWNGDQRGWHPHIHALVESTWVKYEWLRENWLQITGDSDNVRIDSIDDSEKAAGYISKYVTKQFDGSVFHRPDILDEALKALTGSRVMGTFGSWRGVELEGEDAAFDADDWKPLGKLTDIIEAAESGAAWALGLLKKSTAVEDAFVHRHKADS